MTGKRPSVIERRMLDLTTCRTFAPDHDIKLPLTDRSLDAVELFTGHAFIHIPWISISTPQLFLGRFIAKKTKKDLVSKSGSRLNVHPVCVTHVALLSYQDPEEE